MIEINVLILEPHNVNRFREGGGGVLTVTHIAVISIDTIDYTLFPSFPRKICNVNAQYFMNNLFKKKKKKANNENKIIRMIKFENCHWQLNSTGSESDIDMIIFVYVTRISVIFIYALGFLFSPQKI